MDPQRQVASNLFPNFSPITVNIDVPGKGARVFRILRPDSAQVKVTHDHAKNTFVEAFTTTYTGYYNDARPGVSIEQWLRLKSGLTEWLSATFDEEYREYQEGTKEFIYLCDGENKLVGWLSHGPVDEKGDLYLSQCSLEAESRNQKVSTTAFAEALKSESLLKMFPDVKEFKLIARKINTVAERLYTRAGFTKDDTIKPEVYGETYDDRYVGYRLRLKV